MKIKNISLLLTYFLIQSCSHRTSELCNYALPPISNEKQYIQAIDSYIQLIDSCRSFLKNKKQGNSKKIKIVGYFCGKKPIQVQLTHYHYSSNDIHAYSDYYFFDKKLVFYRNIIFLEDTIRKKKSWIDAYYFKNDSCIYYTIDFKQNKQQINENIKHALEWSVTYFNDFDEDYQEAVEDTLTKKAIEWKKRIKSLDRIQRSSLNLTKLFF